MVISGEPPTSSQAIQLTRRDFLKLGGAVIAGEIIGNGLGKAVKGFMLERQGHDLVPFSEIADRDYVRSLERASMRTLGTCGEYIKALQSEDPNKILEAKKLIILGVFAESASRLGGLTKFPISSTLLFHYLNGNGETVDVSSELAKTKYLPSHLEASIRRLRSEQTLKHNNYRENYSLSDLRQFRNQVTSKDGVNYPGVQDGLDWFCGLGTYTENIQSYTVNWRYVDEGENGEGKYALDVNNPTISIFDIYQFDSAFKISPSAFLSKFLQSIIPESVNATLNDLIEKIDKLPSLSNNFKDNIKQTLTYIKHYKYVKDLEKLVIGDITLTGKDVVLLEKFGAKKFDVVGKTKFNGTTSVELDVK